VQLVQLAKVVSNAVMGSADEVMQMVAEVDEVLNQLVDERAVMRKAEVTWPEARYAAASWLTGCSTCEVMLGSRRHLFLMPLAACMR
jgi:hypothetical protein